MQRFLRGETVESRVGDTVELEDEEQQVRRDRRDPILRVGQELGPGWVGRVLGVDELGERGGAAQHLVEPLVGLDGVGQTLPAVRSLDQRQELTPIGCRETLGIPLRGREVGRIGRRVHTRIEIVKVPGRHGGGGDRDRDGTGLMKGGTTAKQGHRDDGSCGLGHDTARPHAAATMAASRGAAANATQRRRP